MWLLVGFVRRDLRVKCFFEIARDLIWRLLDLHNNVNACRKFKIFKSCKTKAVVEMLKALGAEGKALIVTAESDKTVVKSAANIPGVKTATVNTLSVYDILNYDKFIVSSEAVKKIEEVYA